MDDSDKKHYSNSYQQSHWTTIQSVMAIRGNTSSDLITLVVEGMA